MPDAVAMEVKALEREEGEEEPALVSDKSPDEALGAVRVLSQKDDRVWLNVRVLAHTVGVAVMA